MQFAQICFELETPLHIGSGRAGMLAQSHGFVPGHIVSYALAAAIGKKTGGQFADFAAALKLVLENLHCGPLFLKNPLQKDKILFPQHDKKQIEQQFLIASNHVTLMPETRASVEGALFEIEAISPFVVRGKAKGQATELIGGLWYKQEQLAGHSLSYWLNHCLLGGELKTGCGKVKLSSQNGWKEKVTHYAGIGLVDNTGLHLNIDNQLAGVAIDGVYQTTFVPWLGRLFEEQKGFGRTLSEPVFVAMDAKVKADGCFLPKNELQGLGCWTLV